MGTKLGHKLACLLPFFPRLADKGQAAVEFTLVFILLLLIAWIPADFGLAFYTGQLALNASREGARIGAADLNYVGQVGSCSLPACYSFTDGTILKETAKRVSSALLPGATITVLALAGPTCDQTVQVQVVGDYNFFSIDCLDFLALMPPRPSGLPERLKCVGSIKTRVNCFRDEFFRSVTV